MQESQTQSWNTKNLTANTSWQLTFLSVRFTN